VLRGKDLHAAAHVDLAGLAELLDQGGIDSAQVEAATGGLEALRVSG
jgi:hypothetical protein